MGGPRLGASMGVAFEFEVVEVVVNVQSDVCKFCFVYGPRPIRFPGAQFFDF